MSNSYSAGKKQYYKSNSIILVILSVDIKKPTLPLKSSMHLAILEQDNARTSHGKEVWFPFMSVGLIVGSI